MNILAFFAHPDDETMLCGGTMALLARQGAAVYYLSATRGEGGEAGEPPLCPLEELGSVRSAELACAVEALGGLSLDFLDYVDPRIGPDNTLYPFTSDLETLSGQVVDYLRRYSAEVFIAHGSNGEYGHPAHKLVYQAARIAIISLGETAPLFYTFQASFSEHPKPHLMNTDDPAHLVLDISPVKQQKIQATLCHRTQHALFVRNTSKQLGRPVTVPEVVVSLESLHRVHPPVSNSALHDPLAELLLASGCAKAPANSNGLAQK